MPRLDKQQRESIRKAFYGQRLVEYMADNVIEYPVLRYIHALEEDFARRASKFERMQSHNESEIDTVRFDTLTALVEHVIEKPLTQWQRNTLGRWDSMLEESPPDGDVVLRVPSAEDREKQHQLKRIRDVTGASPNKAKHLYASGVRIIEQE